MKNRDLEDLLSTDVLERICDSKNLKPTLILKFAHKKKEVRDVLESYLIAKRALIEPFALKDENNKFKLDQLGNLIIDPSKALEFQKSFHEFLGEETGIDIKPVLVNASVIEDIKLSSNDVVYVSSIIHFEEDDITN